MDENISGSSLKRSIEGRFNRSLGPILDLVEVLAPDPDRFQVVRKQILRIMNDTMREVLKDLDNYEFKEGVDFIVRDIED